METFDQKIAAICIQAKAQCDHLIQKYPQYTQQEIYNVIKIILMPVDILVASFKILPEAQIKSSYKQLALVLHPDKNRFPYAPKAFMKLNEAYLECCGKAY